jgi:hypothetical protein
MPIFPVTSRGGVRNAMGRDHPRAPLVGNSLPASNRPRLPRRTNDIEILLQTNNTQQHACIFA